MLAAIRATLLLTAGLGAVLLALIALNLAHFGDTRLVRFREVTLAIEIVVLLAAFMRADPRATVPELGRRIEKASASPGFFRASMIVMLALFVAAALTQHWAFRTGSHDFSMIDDALDRSLHGSFLFSPLLGRSFLSEHFSPILALLVPLHALIPSPYLLVLIQPLALWSSAVVLAAILRDLSVAPAVRHWVCLIYLNHAVMASTLGYLFHMECLLPLAVFSLYLAYRRRAWWAYALALVMALAIKEDVGLYVAGFAAYAAAADRRFRVATITAITGLAWSLAAVQWAIPAFADGTGGYGFLGRWSQWGHGLGGVMAGLASRPDHLLLALFAKPYLLLFVTMLLLPFATPWGFLMVLAPWTLNATSALAVQSGLGLYYGIPLLAFGALATAIGLRSPSARRVGRSRWGVALGALAVVLGVSHLSFPEIPRDRAAMVGAIEALPGSDPVQLMWCFFPTAGYQRGKILLRPDAAWTARFVVLRTRGSTWPFSNAEAESLARWAVFSGRYRNRSEIPDFFVLERLDRAPRP